jgi:hypothetical protein
MIFSQGKSFLIEGVIKDMESLENLTGCTIQIIGSEIGAATNLDGEFKLLSPFDPTIIQVSYLGYNSVIDTLEFQSTLTINLEIKLKKQYKEIDEIVITPSLLTPKQKAIDDIAKKHIYLYEKFEDTNKIIDKKLAFKYGFEYQNGDTSLMKSYNDYMIKYLEKRNGKNWYQKFKIELLSK